MILGKHEVACAAHDTIVLPGVFDSNLTFEVDWQTREIHAWAALFAQVLYILGVEITWNLAKHSEPRPKILIIGFTLSILRQFEAFAKVYLANLVERMCASTRIETVRTFDYDEVVASGCLLYAPPYKAGGFDVDITLLLATRSQARDIGRGQAMSCEKTWCTLL